VTEEPEQVGQGNEPKQAARDLEVGSHKSLLACLELRSAARVALRSNGPRTAAATPQLHTI
jgi:hypothetical protein